MISVPRGKDDLSLYRGIPSPITLAPWGFGQLLPAVSFSSCEFCNEQRNVLSVSLHPFIFRKRHWSTRYTQFAMILVGVLLGQIPYPYAPFGANIASRSKLCIACSDFFVQKSERARAAACFLRIQVRIGISQWHHYDLGCRGEHRSSADGQ